ncbi:Uncharacterized protein SCF082_LOCUS35638 [Durusdinium trenchii]|uniref:Uncharacterized protein n=1 Tax=Durusdinium trenchii TaxID=1381693 RepID=A0ABP0PA27_9DINO
MGARCTRLGLLGYGLGSLGAETESPSQPSIASKYTVSGHWLDAEEQSPRTSSTSSPLRKLTLHRNQSLPHPALRHSDSWRQAFYVHHPDAQDDDAEEHEVSELMVFAATFVLLHIAMCFVACGYWCLQMYRDFELRNSQEGKFSEKRSKVS